MDREDLRRRSRAFALRIVKLCQALPRTREGDAIARQLVRCGTAVGANYRSACRARSHKEFTAKLAIVVEEADESVFWLELLVDSAVMPKARLEPLFKEANELLSIFAASYKTSRQG